MLEQGAAVASCLDSGATRGQGLGSPASTGRWSVGREGSQCPPAVCEGSLGSTCLQERSGDGA